MLAGVAVTSLVTAVQTFMLQRHSEVVRQVYNWILGSLSTARWSDVRMVLPYVAAATVVLVLHRRHLDLLRVGDDEASSLGAPVARVRLVVVIAATLGTAAVVAVSGLIGFVGIVVPHLIRLLTGSSYYRVLPLSLLIGAAFLILADIPAAGAHRPGRDADRRGDRLHRRPLLPHCAARPAGGPVSERSELDVIVRCSPWSELDVMVPCSPRSELEVKVPCSPRSGEALTGAPPPRWRWSRRPHATVHQ